MSDYPAPRPEDYPSEPPALPEQGSSDVAPTDGSSAADLAKEQARSVAGEVKGQTQQVAAHAAEETNAVLDEAKTQFQDLLWQSRSELTQQANGQQRRLADGLRSFGQELDEMTSGSQRQGLASEAASQLSGRIHQAAGFLENRDVSEVLEELTGFARRRPGAFLLGAALIGVVAGRVTRGLTADSDESGTSNVDAPYTVEPPRYEGVATDVPPPVAPYGAEAVPTAYQAPSESARVAPSPLVERVEPVEVPYASTAGVTEPPRSGAFPTGAADERLP